MRDRAAVISVALGAALMALAIFGVVSGPPASAAGGSSLISLPPEFPTITLPSPTITFGPNLPTITLPAPGDCSISVSPTNSQIPGGPVTVTGQNWIPNEEALVRLEGHVVATAGVMQDGTFSATFNMPAWGTSQTYGLSVVTQQCSSGAWIQYGVDDLSGSAPGCTLSAQPAGGSFVGEPVSLSFTGVVPGQTVTISAHPNGSNVIFQGTPSLKAVFGVPGLIPGFVFPEPGFMYLISESCQVAIPYNYYGEGNLPTVQFPGVTLTLPEQVSFPGTGVTFAGPGLGTEAGSGEGAPAGPTVTNEAGEVQIGTAFDGSPIFAAAGSESTDSSSTVLVVVGALLALGLGFFGGIVWARKG